MLCEEVCAVITDAALRKWSQDLGLWDQIVALKADDFSPFCSCLYWIKDAAIYNTTPLRLYWAFLSLTIMGP